MVVHSIKVMTTKDFARCSARDLIKNQERECENTILTTLFPERREGRLRVWQTNKNSNLAFAWGCSTSRWETRVCRETVNTEVFSRGNTGDNVLFKLELGTERELSCKARLHKPV